MTYYLLIRPGTYRVQAVELAAAELPRWITGSHFVVSTRARLPFPHATFAAHIQAMLADPSTTTIIADRA